MNMEFDMALIMPDPSVKFSDRCLQAFSNNPNSYFFRQLAVVLASYGYSLDNSWNDLSPEVQDIIWNGAGERKFTFYYENLQGETKLYDKEYEGVINILKRRYREAFSDAMRQEYEEFMTSFILFLTFSFPKIIQEASKLSIARIEKNAL